MLTFCVPHLHSLVIVVLPPLCDFAFCRGEVSSDPVLTRVMDARQYALKMIANVSYGYTSAGFSGRMPCAEIADSIVQVLPCSFSCHLSLVSFPSCGSHLMRLSL